MQTADRDVAAVDAALNSVLAEHTLAAALADNLAIGAYGADLAAELAAAAKCAFAGAIETFLRALKEDLHGGVNPLRSRFWLEGALALVIDFVARWRTAACRAAGAENDGVPENAP